MQGLPHSQEASLLPLFSFGSLMDNELLEMVSGMPASSLAMQLCYALGVVQHCVQDESYPVLVDCPGERAEGLLIKGLTPLAMDRILFFEGHQYLFDKLTVYSDDGTSQSACYFRDASVYETTAHPWSFQHWLQHDKQEMLERTQRFMQLFGTMSALEADPYW
ncbi:MAG: gamma-glutamylcyclotransferase family protein [Granulosicoccus sp.]